MTSLPDMLKNLYRSLILPLLPTRPNADSFFPNQDSKPQITGEWSKRFFSHKGLSTGKWWGYLPIYDEIVHWFKSVPREGVLLEIGVGGGGSLEIWRDCLADTSTTVVGVDINPDCATLPLDGCEIYIGSQSDSSLVHRIIADFGSIDVVIDDGSHEYRDQIATLRALWPSISTGGYYIIEDLHTSYWLGHGGFWGRRSTAIGLCKRLLDVMHKPYHRFRMAPDLKLFENSLESILIRDSMMILRKSNRVVRVNDVRP